MSLIDDVKTVCDRLAPRGWRDLLLAVTNNALDISQSSRAKLKTALTTPLATVDRMKPGFDDFHPTGARAITGGHPARSLLYHAFASPHVHPTATGTPSSTPTDYPTLAELDVIENFIYSQVADRPDLDETIVAVFAYQYRTASRTPHLRHADLAYSRTGVARVGTTRPHYDRSRRGPYQTSDRVGGISPTGFIPFTVRGGAAGSVALEQQERSPASQRAGFSFRLCVTGKNPGRRIPNGEPL